MLFYLNGTPKYPKNMSTRETGGDGLETGDISGEMRVMWSLKLKFIILYVLDTIVRNFINHEI